MSLVTCTGPGGCGRATLTLGATYCAHCNKRLPRKVETPDMQHLVAELLKVAKELGPQGRQALLREFKRAWPADWNATARGRAFPP